MGSVSSEDELSARLAQGRARLLQRVERRRRVQRASVLGAAAVVVGLGLAAGVGAAAPGAVAARVSCYTAADLAANHTTVTLSAGQSVGTLTVLQQQRLCDHAWSGEGSRIGVAAVGAVACRLAGGAVAIFPLEHDAPDPGKVCDRLGLTSMA